MHAHSAQNPSPAWHARARRGLTIGGLGAFGFFAAVSSLAGCEDSKPAALLQPDSGPPCQLGERNCACSSSGGCRDGLLCTAGRCLPTEGDDSPDDVDTSRPPPLEPPDQRADAAASEPDAAAHEPADASNPSDGSSELDSGTIPDTGQSNAPDTGVQPDAA